MSTEPLTHCVVCLVNKLTLAELAHSPCKHCHVEYCTECLKTAFAIAEKDDICEVFCPNPHCKKALNADCMQIKAENIKLWVDQELTQPQYGVLVGFNNWTAEDLVTFIMNQRHRDLNELRRKSSVWEEEIIQLKVRAQKADLNDVPLRPKLLTNQSQDRIDLRSKFRTKPDSGLTRSQSAHSLSTAYRNNHNHNDKHKHKHSHKIPLFTNNNANISDDDLSDIGNDDLPRASTTSRKYKRGLDTIIDEDEEFHEYEYEYQSPVSIETNVKSNKSRLSFKALFHDHDVESAKKTKKNKNVRVHVRIQARSRTQSEDVYNHNVTVTPKQLHKRSGSNNNRIYNPFKKYKSKNEKRKKRRLKKTMSLREVGSVSGHNKSLKLMQNRAKTPDPLHGNGRDRSKSEKTATAPPLPAQNVMVSKYSMTPKIVSKSVPQSQMNELKIHTTATLVVQLKPPQTTPSASSAGNTPISELSQENNICESPPPKSSPGLQNYNTSTKSGILTNINALTLAPIHSARELNEGYPPLVDATTVLNDDDDDKTSESSFQIQSDTEEDMHGINVEDIDDIDALQHIPNTFITDTDTNTHTITMDTNTNTMVMPIPNEVFPGNIKTQLQGNISGILIEINGVSDKKSESGTPDTPPTPESPNSGSMESGSHYERVMRNLDNFSTVQTQTQQTQTQTQEKINDPAQHIGDSNGYEIRNKSPEPPEMEPGCNGCQACIIL